MTVKKSVACMVVIPKFVGKRSWKFRGQHTEPAKKFGKFCMLSPELPAVIPFHSIQLGSSMINSVPIARGMSMNRRQPSKAAW